MTMQVLAQDALFTFNEAPLMTPLIDTRGLARIDLATDPFQAASLQGPQASDTLASEHEDWMITSLNGFEVLM